MQACNGTVFWAYNLGINRRWFKKILFIKTKFSNLNLLLNFVAFRISREANPVPAIANFRDLINQEVFLLAAYGDLNGLFYGCCCCNLVLFFVCLPVFYVLTIIEWRWVWYEELCRSRRVLSTEAEGAPRLMIPRSAQFFLLKTESLDNVILELWLA